ncbi:hypothetical protein B9G69_015035 [Bdellovibrio sp. SKB1291214]|uniref:hypothetical protein n=1 Tax=Bdellovibrio sp. SKB1291214 TaxID=1732569 RepID=UPI001595FA1F|nr:hypothetical protein [Bdellovibrio sp. SKB1291214]UYL08355.1 hypothetical protein B9G69_015035 [Bdellovibrio sp. SKB1291214]
MNHQRTFHQRLLKSQRGSVLLLSVLAGIVISIMFFASIGYIETQAKVMEKAAVKSDRRVVMDGLYAYTVNAIKQSWCLTETWVEDQNCSLTHDRNTVRLSLSDEALLFIRNSGTPAATPITATRLSSMGTTIILSSLPPSHPLYSIVSPLAGDYSTLKFTIERDSSAISAVRGREVPIKITIFLQHKSNTEFDQTLVSRNIIYPRELSYFGLILPNNLSLASGSDNPQKGDVNFPNIDVPAGSGLRFESPVFINGDLRLPNSSFTTPMNNVTFVDKIFLAGVVRMDGMQDENKYMVKTAGGKGYMYNYEMPNFAGLMNGFEIDPAPDKGLKYLFNLGVTGDSGYDALAQCRDRLMASYQLSITDDAQLWIRPVKKESNKVSVQLNLGNTDNFVEQDIDGYKTTTTVPNITGPAAVPSNVAGQPVMKVQAYYNGLQAPGTPTRGSYSSEFYVYRTGTTTVYPTGNSGGGSIVFQATPNEIGSRVQYNQVNLDITFNSLNLGPYIAENGNVLTYPSVKFVFEAYDYGYNAGVNLRKSTAKYPKKVNGLTFNLSGSALVLDSSQGNTFSVPTIWANNSGLADDQENYAWPSSDDTYKKRHGVSDTNWSDFDQKCFATPSPSDPNPDFASFPAAKWDTDFSTQARNSWSFDTEFNLDPIPGYRNSTILYDNPLDNTFHIDSLVNTCSIGPNIDIWAGMVACEKFEIRQRQRPLRIIGTVITKQVAIHQSAYEKGIRWSTIYHPQATQELINAGILGKGKATKETVACGSAAAPLWQSNIGINDRYIHWNCNPVSLRTADPFKWSTVDPDCGLQDIKGSTAIKCKKKTTRFLIKEISRGKGL